MGAWRLMPLRSFSFSFSSFLARRVILRPPGIWPCSSVGRADPQSGARSPVRVRPRPVCARTFRVFIFLLAPRKDGERPKGHGADCGKTLYRRLTVLNYAPEKGKGHPVCSTGSVGGCNDPQQAGNRLYMPPCSCMRRRRLK